VTDGRKHSSSTTEFTPLTAIVRQLSPDRVWRLLPKSTPNSFLVTKMELELRNCSGTADREVDLIACVEVASNLTGVGYPPRSRYTSTCRVYDFVVETILMGSLCLFGFAGNTLSMICLRHDKSRSATPLLLISLEISDTLFLSVVLVVRVISSFQVYAPITHVFLSFLRRTKQSGCPPASVVCESVLVRIYTRRGELLLSTSVRPSVRLSVKRGYCDKTK